MSLDFQKILFKFEEEQRVWLAQFKEGDIWKPRWWKCKKFFRRYCEYKPFSDPACDSCIHCGHPYERK